MKNSAPPSILIVIFGLSLRLSGCSSFQQLNSASAPSIPTPTAAPTAPTPASSTASPSVVTSTAASASGTASKAESNVSSASQAKTATATTASTVQQFASAKPPLTVEKLKNAQYYFLAKGPIQLVNGAYADQATKRSFALGDVVAYGDINKDGIKDAATTLKVTVPNTGDFSYLVVLVNEAGAAKNISTEFMGSQIKVKTLKINADNSIEAVMDQYQAGDPACCPSVEIKRNYKLKSHQTKPAATQPKPK